MTEIARRLVYLFLSVLILSLAACSPNEIPDSGDTETPVPEATVTEVPETTEPPTLTPTAPPAETGLENTQWTLVSFGEPGAETQVIEGTQVTLVFEEAGQAGGSGGCNTFSAPYEVQDGAISFREIVSTEVACTAEGVMEQEQQYFQALQTAGEFELAGDELTLQYDNGSEALNFVSSDSLPTPTTVSDLLCSNLGGRSITDLNLCRSEKYGFEVQFPPGGELVDHTATSARIDLPFTPGTNLSEKYLELTVTENAGTCSSPLAEGHAPGTIPTEPVEVNDLEFIKETGQDAGAGNIYTWEAYSTSRDGRCVSLGFVLRSFQPELEPTPPPEYDPEEESRVFQEILSTFRWLEPAGGPAATPSPGTGTATTAPTSSARPTAGTPSAGTQPAAAVTATSAAPGLTGFLWAWQGVRGAGAEDVSVTDPLSYTLSLLPDGDLAFRADCNQGSGSYELEGDGSISIDIGAMTLVACPPGSLSERYLSLLEQAQSYELDGSTLSLDLQDGGEMIFSVGEREIEVTAEPEAGEASVTTTEPLNILSGPGSQYPSYGQVPRGTVLLVVGKSPDGAWWAVQLPDDIVADGYGWVAGRFVEAENTEDVPVIQPPAPS